MWNYLWRRMMVWTTWRLMTLNRALSHWNATLRDRAVVNRAGMIVERERTKALKERLTRRQG